MRTWFAVFAYYVLYSSVLIQVKMWETGGLCKRLSVALWVCSKGFKACCFHLSKEKTIFLLNSFVDIKKTNGYYFTCKI